MVTEYWPKDTKKWDQWVDFIDLARKYDEATGQKECQDPEKIKVLGDVIEHFNNEYDNGVSLERAVEIDRIIKVLKEIISDNQIPSNASLKDKTVEKEYKVPRSYNAMLWGIDY